MDQLVNLLELRTYSSQLNDIARNGPLRKELIDAWKNPFKYVTKTMALPTYYYLEEMMVSSIQRTISKVYKGETVRATH